MEYKNAGVFVDTKGVDYQKSFKEGKKSGNKKKQLIKVGKVLFGVSSICLVFIFIVPLVFAGCPFGEMIPKGMNWISFYEVYTSTKKKYDNNGDKYAFPDGIEHAHTLDYAYGLTNDLNIGVSIPYYEAILKAQPVQRAQGLTNVKVGGQYRYYKTDDLGLTFRLLAKLPTGKPDDPNNPDDIARGGEETTLEFYQFIDCYLMDKKYILSGQVRVNWIFEEKYNQSTSRQASTGDTYMKDSGDELWLAAGFQRNDFIIPGLSPNIRLEARYHSRDDYKSASHSWDASKEEDTSSELYFVQPELRYSAYKKYKIPLRVYVKYRIPLAGRNTYVTERIEAGTDIFF